MKCKYWFMTPAPNIDMFLLHRHMRFQLDVHGRYHDIMPLMIIREIIELVPHFGAKMDGRLDCNNSLEIGDNFYLNNFADKDTFHAILTYQ